MSALYDICNLVYIEDRSLNHRLNQVANFDLTIERPYVKLIGRGFQALPHSGERMQLASVLT